MRISDWSSDVCSSDLRDHRSEVGRQVVVGDLGEVLRELAVELRRRLFAEALAQIAQGLRRRHQDQSVIAAVEGCRVDVVGEQVGEAALFLTVRRSEEHTSELQSLMRISYAVFCLKKKNKKKTRHSKRLRNTQ